MSRAALAIVALAAFAGGCGGATPFVLTGVDNDPVALTAALRAMHAPGGERLNGAGDALVALATDRQLTLIDLASGKPRWQVAAAVRSRVAIGGTAAIAVESGNQLVARDLATGVVSWKRGLPGALVGLAADRAGRVYVTVKDGGSWWIAAWDSRGERLWEAESRGRLGAPAAAGELVAVPFLSQWLALLDAGTGRSLTRIRGLDEEIDFVAAHRRRLVFGSGRGLVLLDRRAASGLRSQGTYLAASLPEAFSDLRFHRDGYDVHQSGYSAADRRRLHWRAEPRGERLILAGDAVIAHWYRYLFGLSPGGELRWAYSHPRADLVGAEHLGGALLAVATDGAAIALDPESGAELARFAFAVEGRVVGATFDAGGWSPPRPADLAPRDTIAVLGAIASDRDARFGQVKRYAVAALGESDDLRAAIELIELAGGRGELADRARERLAARGDTRAVPLLLAGLAARTDHVAGTRARCVAACAAALATLPRQAIPARERRGAITHLVHHLESPATPAAALEPVAAALVRHGGHRGLAALRRFITLYRADPLLADRRGALAVITAALAAAGRRERKLLEELGADPVTEPALAAAARRALDPRETK
jgi:outer membrane protein assembly factor BamB